MRREWVASREPAATLEPAVAGDWQDVESDDTVNRTLRYRVLTGWLTAMFIFAVEGGAYGYHHRLHHGWPAQPAASGPHDSHGGQAAGSRESGGHGSPASSGSGHSAPCTCVGSCHASAAIPLGGKSVDVTNAGPPSGSVSVVLRGDQILPALLPYVLPYSNGSPPNG